MKEHQEGHFMADVITDEPINSKILDDESDLEELKDEDFVVINLPRIFKEEYPQYQSEKELNESEFGDILSKVRKIIEKVDEEHVVGIISENTLVPYLTYSLFEDYELERTFTVRLEENVSISDALETEHLAMTFFSSEDKDFKFNKLRIAYRYCPACEKTTKDYGGKKHLYHEFGTMQRDVWKHPEIEINPFDSAPENLTKRLRYMFSRNEYNSFNFVGQGFIEKLDTGDEDIEVNFPDFEIPESTEKDFEQLGNNVIVNEDSVESLPKIPDNSVDLVFLDPPYNIGKDYSTYDDDKEAEDYFEWCDKWLSHCVRVLKEGGVLVGLNIPKASYRWFMSLTQELKAQNIVCWDSMSKPPAGNIMPTYYPILIFSKGELETFNYEELSSINEEQLLEPENDFKDKFIYPMDDGYCKRNSCINKRRKNGEAAKKELTDLWTDIFRLKHNSKREDHPTMLPPKMMRRILGLLTDDEDIVLDPFNGVGTTTLTADQMGRRFTGFEISEEYAEIARDKHQQIRDGKDPFDKDVESISPPSSNGKNYKIPKKDLQLEIKRIAEKIGHIPDKDEAEEHSKYPMKYYEDYFDGWADVTKAAKTTGMSEDKDGASQTSIRNYE